MKLTRHRLTACALAFLGASAFLISPQARAEEFSGAQKMDIERIVHDYLVTKPEVIKEAIEALNKKEKLAEAAAREKILTKDADKLFNSSNQAVVGNPNGDVTVVEFFDYNCGYCKQSLANVAKLIETDPKVRVVLKDFAILGPDSVEAAEVATAVRTQFKGAKFWDFHRKLLETRGHIGKQQAVAVAKELGADVDQLEKDIKRPETRATLEEVDLLAEGLHFSGTPSWVIGKEAIIGGVSFGELKSKIDNVRKCGKATC
ncbi:DsbA family protein [Methylocystis heyeri]|uniref:Thioredoxin domain-containing protein n=1 Tax=Methylocystis heyeri TaxID=391905 RepID=A0A6B8K9F6_9HYPH|nr:DsbA family protein [Methylocystis heyeri]QGM44726.1 thioredoxin domain-containing protein [Methylocystis heyeri]